MSNKRRRKTDRQIHKKAFQRGNPHDPVTVFVCLLCKAKTFTVDNDKLTKTRDGFAGMVPRHYLNSPWFSTFTDHPYHTVDPDGNTIHIDAVHCPHLDSDMGQFNTDQEW